MVYRALTALLLVALSASGAFAQEPAPPVPVAPDPSPSLQPALPLPVDAPVQPSTAPRPTTLATDFGGPFGGPGGAGALGGPPGPPRADYRVLWEPGTHVTGQNADLSRVSQDLNFFSPLWVDGPDAVTFTLHARNEQTNSSAILSDSHLPFPEDLWDIRAGVLYFHRFDNGWSAGGSVSVGSASDKPFQSINEVSVGVAGFLRIPSGDHNAWLLSLTYDTNGQLPFPIPGVAYSWQVNDQLHVNVGLPFEVHYRPLEDLSFDFSYMLLTTARARLTYRIAPALKVYGSYEYGTESYFLADRDDPQQRFFYNEMRLTTGVTWVLTEYSTLDLSGGYAFDREYFQGHNSTSETDLIQVAPGPFVGLRLGLHY